MSENGGASNVEGIEGPVVVVGIGASAGGVEALEKLFAGMPTDIGMALVIVQHLSDEYESLMPQILSRKTELPVQIISDGTKLEQNRVYVLPGGKTLSVHNATLFLEEPGIEKCFNPIDRFFNSLAEDLQENVIGVVLSGTGSDGSSGIQKIHAAGGFVVVQNETSAKFNGMPRAAIATGIADVITTVEEIPDTLFRFGEFLQLEGKSGRSLFVEAQGAEKRLRQLLHQRFGIDFEQYKTAMFGRRLSRRMMLTKHGDVQDYLKFIHEDEDEQEQLYSDLLIGVTEFFRDPKAFIELQHRVLPDLIAQGVDDGELRVWVAPCATGEEAYSLAILIDELVQQRKYDLSVKIFATDVNDDCVAVASQGVYSDDRLINVSKERLAKYFKKTNEGWQIIPRIRKQIIFATQNVLQDAPFTKLHLITCRNLLIYFQEEAKKKVLSLFNFSLKRDGVLFLGPSESTSELEAAFKPVNENWRIYRKLTPIKFSQVDLAIGNAKQKQTDKTEAEISVDIRDRELASVYDSLLAEVMPPGLLIDNQNEILHIFGDASKFLRFQSGRPTSDLMELLPTNFKVAISNGLKRVRIESKPVVYPELECDLEGEHEFYRVSIRPLLTKFGVKFLITFEAIESASETLTTLNEFAADTAAKDLIRSLEEELQETRESLHDSILNLKAANEEMQSTNEELIAANEELQSTNEELHSVNEELYTVNAEHQRKITELTELTDDMDNLLDSIQVDTVYLDRDFRVRKFTLGIARTFKLLPQDIGRDFTTFNHDLGCENLIEKIRLVLKTERSIDEEIQDKDGDWYLMRLLPYQSRDTVDGVLLTLIDITPIKQVEQQLAELSEIVKSSDDAIFRITPDGTIRTWNRGAEMLFSHSAESIVGKKIDVLTLNPEGQSTMANALEKIVRHEKIEHIEMKAVRRNGEEVDVQMSVSPIFDPLGALIAASIVLRDFTKQKQVERANIEAVRSRDQFLAVLSHELRNPISAMMNALAILKSRDFGTDNWEVALDVILRHSKQLAKLLDDLLDVSRITHDKIKLNVDTINLTAVAKEVVEYVELRLQEKDQNLTLELPNEPVWVDVDATRIIQAQVNLLVNATKYTPNGGNIRYSISVIDNSASIEVQDDGEGMSESLLRKVFEVFVQADQPLDRNVGGMGLGLPLVQMIAQAHGGEISAESDGVGKGSKFTLTIPLSDNETGQRHNPVPDVDVKVLNGATLLLVEDNDSARMMLAEFLRHEGLQVETAANGIDGIQRFDERPTSVCVVDIGLPDLNGYEVAGHIRKSEHQPDLLIALTGYGQEKDRQAVLNAGFDLHIVKPIDPVELLQVLARNLENAEAIN